MKTFCDYAPYVERWDDPGDYPNQLAGHSLPSHNYVESIEGVYRLIHEPGDEWPPSESDLEDVYCDAASLARVKVTEWETKIIKDVIELRVIDFEDGSYQD